MTFDQLVEIASDLHCFCAGMVTAGEDINVVRVQLSRWVSSGRLIRIHKGWYTLREPFRRVRPLSIDSPVGRIGYRHVKRDVFFGYTQEVSGMQEAYIAVPEKALLDLFYLTPGSEDAAYIEELRLQGVEKLDLQGMAGMAERFGAPRLLRAVHMLDEVLGIRERRDAE